MGIFDGIGSLFTGSGMEEAEAARQAELNRGYERYRAASGAARGAVTDQYTAALQPYLQLQGGAAGGYDAYADATGANGPEGLARARANFQAMVQPDINMGVDAATRALSARGVAAGNIGADVSKMVGNELFGRYGDYTSRLAPWLSQGLGIAQGLGNIYTGLGTNLANIFGAEGTAGLNLGQQLGESRYAQEFAPTLGAQNLVNFGLQLGNTAAGFANPMAAAAGRAGTSLWNSSTGNFLGPGSFNTRR